MKVVFKSIYQAFRIIFGRLRLRYYFRLLIRILFKSWLSLIHVSDVYQRKKVLSGIALNAEEKMYVSKLQEFGFVVLGKDFFGKDAIADVLSYGKGKYASVLSEIPSILEHKNTRSISRDDIVDSDHPLKKITLDEKLLSIVSIYMNCIGRVHSSQIVVSRQIDGNPRHGSQKWHIDDVDITMVKLIVYISDVLEDEHGPFMLLRPNLPESKVVRRLGGHLDEEVLRSEGIEVDPTIVYGSSMTAFLVDTARCPHQGSVELSRDRLAFISGYAPRTAWSPGIRNVAYSPETAMTQLYTS